MVFIWTPPVCQGCAVLSNRYRLRFYIRPVQVETPRWP
jgi:hypothetical protein